MLPYHDLTERKAAWRRRSRTLALSSWLMSGGPRIPPELVSRYFRSSGDEELKTAVESGSGVIIVMLHQAGIRAISWAIRAKGIPFYWLCLPPKSRLRHFVQRLRYWQHRRLFGADSLVFSDSAGTRRLYALLRQGEIVCMAQDLRGTRYKVPILGRDVTLALGAVRIAMTTGAQLVPAVVVPDETGLLVRFGPAIVADQPEDQLAVVVAEQLEDLIRSARELWNPQWQ